MTGTADAERMRDLEAAELYMLEGLAAVRAWVLVCCVRIS